MDTDKRFADPGCGHWRVAFFYLALSLVLVFGTTSVWSMETEVEPNDSCATAQVIDTGMPFEIAGELGVSVADIDFFQISAPAGELVQIDLQGFANNMGSLSDPYLGLFEAGNCLLTNADDDSGLGTNSRLLVTMPESGVIVVAATEFPDFGFSTGGFGSYVLAVQRVGLIGSISAQLVDSETSVPLSGNAEPFAGASLARCSVDIGCSDFVAFQTADDEGRLRFERDFFGNPLAAGSYAIQAAASGYNPAFTPAFFVAEGEHIDVGAIAVDPVQFVGSLSGRLVDATTGQPLPGNTDPFGRVLVERCLDSEFCFGAAFVYTDGQGLFSVDGNIFGLPPGDYRIRGFADNYLEDTSAIVTIGHRQDYNFHDVGIAPIPVRISNVSACELPPGGGTCSFGAEVVNVGSRRYQGEAWAQIEYFGGPVFTRFQVGRQGAGMPDPIKVNLNSGQSHSLRFKLELPNTLADGAFACATLWLGQSPHAQLNPTAQQFAFCVSKTSAGLTVMKPNTARKLLDKHREERSINLPNAQRSIRH